MVRYSSPSEIWASIKCPILEDSRLEVVWADPNDLRTVIAADRYLKASESWFKCRKSFIATWLLPLPLRPETIMAWGYLVSFCNLRASLTTLESSGLVEVTEVKFRGLPMSRCELTASTIGPTLVWKTENKSLYKAEHLNKAMVCQLIWWRGFGFEHFLYPINIYQWKTRLKSTALYTLYGIGFE